MKRKRAKLKRARPSRRAWIRATESGTRRWMPGDLVTASSVYDGLAAEIQLAIAQEIVETRGVELARAYPGVIDVSFGSRRRRRQHRGRYEIVPTVCVRFMVKRKLPRDQMSADMRIPSRLFTYCQVGADRRLCAVPTDVEDASTFAGALAQAEPVQVHWKTSTVNGVVTCALARDGVEGSFALSCRHLLSLTELRHGEATWGADVLIGQASVGHTGSIAGPLRIPPDRSFDAQLMEVDNVAALRRALAGVTAVGIATGFPDVPAEYSILTARGGIVAKRVGLVYDRPYYLGRVGYIAHYVLIEGALDVATAGGDSGSPVVGETSRGRLLLGMHVAGVDNGPGKRFAYMIPAWQLFDPSNYDGVNNSEQWALSNP